MLLHPTNFTWDFWYYYDGNAKLFHILYLNADSSLVQSNKHHFSARIGYATTKEFQSIDWINDDVFHASEDGWDNTSIWSGDVVRISDRFLFYYTSRDKNVDNGFTQNIGLAQSTDFIHWSRVEDVQIRPDERYYEPRSIEGDSTIHAWRDPFLFRTGDGIYMLLSSKSKNLPLHNNGSIALLRSKDNSLTDWEILPPLFSTGWYSECEVSQIYLQGEDYVLAYSSWAKFDGCPFTNKAGGLQGVTYSKISPFAKGLTGTPEVLLPESSGLYACRVIPELQGDIVGFDIEKGGFQRVPAKTGLKAINRDFTEFSLK
ncbi:MAG: beta-fructosidase [Candidatus Thorarchaeota archaeon]